MQFLRLGALLLAVLAPGASAAFAQCVNHPLTPPAESIFATPETDKIMTDLLAPIQKFTPISIAARVVRDKDLPGSVALACYDKTANRLILIDEEFLQKSDSWAVLGAVAHEIGHHVRAHMVFNHSTKVQDQRVPGKRRELEADYIAGYLMNQIGATRAETVSALKKLGTGDSPTHPARYERVLRAIQGWTDADGERKLEPSKDATEHPLDLFELEQNADIEGADIGFSWPGLTVEQCAKHCLDRGYCLGFSYQKWASTCYLKRDLQLTLRDPRSVVGVVKPLDIPLAFKSGGLEMLRRPKRLFQGRYEEATATDIKACRARCEKNKQERSDATVPAEKKTCVGFSFFATTKMCRTFAEIDKPVDGPGIDSAFFADNYSWINPD